MVESPKGNFSAHWIFKYKEFFNILDVDENGMVTEEEFIDSTTKRAQQILPSWRAMAVNGILSSAYDLWWLNKYTNYSKSITFQDWLRADEVELPITREDLVKFAKDWFDALDLDCDSKLMVDEYSNFLILFRNTGKVQDIFDAINWNKDGVIDTNEFIHAFMGYWADQEPSPSDVFLGTRY
ncbi:mitrocomin-like [Lingula anatina]|uniref:Mitrocomin-like n=1 Tax=Lingula anatina TaxID=7574 RepID=A0A1S3JH51_LINAN|nr:mitrocomin-like [Lingula anatina]|eukprot:XP_013409727.1 mitrocomin-like [Lingula anatina]